MNPQRGRAYLHVLVFVLATICILSILHVSQVLSALCKDFNFLTLVFFLFHGSSSLFSLITSLCVKEGRVLVVCL